MSYILTDCSNDLLVGNDKTANVQPHRTLGEPLLELSHHQSGINCLSITHVQDDVFLVASGGDDTDISVSSLKFSRGDDYGSITVKCMDTFKVCNAHATQVTGEYKPYARQWHSQRGAEVQLLPQ